MDTIIQDSANKIKKMYKNLTYFDEYGSSVILMIILLTALFWIHGYCSVMSNIQPIKDNWLENRCKPNIIPFAGLINKPEGQTITEFTQNNFTDCVQNMVIPVTVNAVSPFDFLTNSLLAIYQVILEAIQKIRGMISAVRDSFSTFAKDVLGRILNFLIPVQQLVLSAKDTMAKVAGVMQDAANTCVATYYMLKSLLGNIVTGSIRILLIGVATMIGMYGVLILLSIFFFPGALLFLGSVIVPGQILYIVVVVILLLIVIFLETVLHVHPDGVIPGLPDTPPLSSGSCFDKNTPLFMKDGDQKKIIDVNIGDVLQDSSVITAKMKLDATNVDMYDLFGIIVSGVHSVQYRENWIYVADHPFAVKIDDYKENFIYCLNTTKNEINIDGLVFIDWNELFTTNSLDVHQYYDGGFVGDTPIMLQDGNIISIMHVKIGDVLEHGEVVYGIVLVDGTGMDKQYKYENGILGHFLSIHSLEKEELAGANRASKLYHLLTDKKEFHVKNIQVHDYNYYIDIHG